MRHTLLAILFATILGALPANGDSPPVEPQTFRIGISYASFGTINRNDASAALKAWAAALSKERKIDHAVEVELFEREQDLRKALKNKSVEAASMTAEEFMASGEYPQNIFLTAKNTNYTQQYVVLVHASLSTTDLSNLKGSRLVRHSSPITSLALPWLETELARSKLGRAKYFFGEVSSLENPSKCVLRVFFRQSDACLVTAKAFELACELNPQLRRSIKVALASPPLIPTLFFFRPGYASPAYRQLEEAILELHSTPAGQQVLTIFQGSRMNKQPLCCFDYTRTLLNQYREVVGPPTVTTADLGYESTNTLP